METLFTDMQEKETSFDKISNKKYRKYEIYFQKDQEY